MSSIAYLPTAALEPVRQARSMRGRLPKNVATLRKARKLAREAEAEKARRAEFLADAERLWQTHYAHFEPWNLVAVAEHVRLVQLMRHPYHRQLLDYSPGHFEKMVYVAEQWEQLRAKGPQP